MKAATTSRFHSPISAASRQRSVSRRSMSSSSRSMRVGLFAMAETVETPSDGIKIHSGSACRRAGSVRGLALSRRADAVVLDVDMPGLDGGRAAEVIRAYRPRVKVLFHTAEVDGALRRRAERLDAPILLKGDPDFALHALTELLTETND